MSDIHTGRSSSPVMMSSSPMLTTPILRYPPDKDFRDREAIHACRSPRAWGCWSFPVTQPDGPVNVNVLAHWTLDGPFEPSSPASFPIPRVVSFANHLLRPPPSTPTRALPLAEAVPLVASAWLSSSEPDDWSTSSPCAKPTAVSLARPRTSSAATLVQPESDVALAYDREEQAESLFSSESASLVSPIDEGHLDQSPSPSPELSGDRWANEAYWISDPVDPVDLAPFTSPAKTFAPSTYLSHDEILFLLTASRSVPPRITGFDYFTHCPFLIQHRHNSRHAILPWLARILLAPMEHNDPPPGWADYRIAQSLLCASLPDEIVGNDVVAELLSEKSDVQICFHGFGRAINNWVRNEPLLAATIKVECGRATSGAMPLHSLARQRTPTLLVESALLSNPPCDRLGTMAKRGKENRPPNASLKRRRLVTAPASAPSETVLG